jgi:hypothetical protein
MAIRTQGHSFDFVHDVVVLLNALACGCVPALDGLRRPSRVQRGPILGQNEATHRLTQVVQKYRTFAGGQVPAQHRFVFTGGKENVAFAGKSKSSNRSLVFRELTKWFAALEVPARNSLVETPGQDHAVRRHGQSKQSIG